MRSSVMNLIEQIDREEWIYFREISEPDINVLRIVIEGAKTSIETYDIDLGGAKIADVHPIVSDETCDKYEIIFGSYIAYAVLNESYASVDEGQESTGKYFRVYSKSRFLDYVGAASFASEDYPGNSTHYEIACLDHIVEVVSVDEPEINLMRRA
jgi:hypothetical protein